MRSRNLLLEQTHMQWANFFHIYQPIQQTPEMLSAIIAECYRPLLAGIDRSPRARVTLNVTGALLELFNRFGYRDLIALMAKLGNDGKIEFTGSAKYHALLPFLDDDEIHRQIVENTATCKAFLGDAYRPRGFFPPEMAYTPRLGKIIRDEGFEWCILDEIAKTGSGADVDYQRCYKTSDGLVIFFRERRLSNLIMGAVVRSAASLKEAMRDELASDRVVITAMDGETFGHHRPGLEQLLFEIFDDPDFRLVTMSELLKQKFPVEEVNPVSSTWASSPRDIAEGIQFISWADPSNDIHFLQKEFVDHALKIVRRVPLSATEFADLRTRMDAALASDHFFWASAKPWWSIEMIEDGAYRLLSIVRDAPGTTEDDLRTAARFYEQIVSTAFEWQRSGKIRRMYEEQHAVTRIPFYDRTVGAGGERATEFPAFIELFRKMEERATAKREYEQAILWRDAVYKIEQKHDIFDAVHVVDLLRARMGNEEVERTLEEYKKRYRELRSGQPEQRGR